MAAIVNSQLISLLFFLSQSARRVEKRRYQCHKEGKKSNILGVKIPKIPILENERKTWKGEGTGEYFSLSSRRPLALILKNMTRYQLSVKEVVEEFKDEVGEVVLDYSSDSVHC